MSAAPMAWGESFFGRGVAMVAVVAVAWPLPFFAGARPFFAVPLERFPEPLPFFAAVALDSGCLRAGGDRSTAASGALRRGPLRAGRTAGIVSAGRSARIRGATIVREV